MAYIKYGKKFRNNKLEQSNQSQPTEIDMKQLGSKETPSSFVNINLEEKELI